MKKLTDPKLRKKLIKECDNLVAQIVKAKDPNCVICTFRGEKRSFLMEAGHVIPKKKSALLRWDLHNVFTQCQYHNSLHRFDTYPYDEWYIATFGVEAWNALHEKRKQIKSWKIWELEELRDELKLML